MIFYRFELSARLEVKSAISEVKNVIPEVKTARLQVNRLN